MENKKTWLYGVVAVAAVAAIALGVSMKGSYFQGKIGGPVTGPVTDVGKGSAPITKDLWAAYLTRNDKGVNTATKDCAPDIIGNQYAKYICYALSKGYFETDTNGKFNPNNTLTRAKGVKTLAGVFKIPTYTAYTGPQLANDVKSTDWFFGFANALINKGCPDTIDENKNFRPAESLTISEAKNWVLCAQGKSMSKPVTGPATKPVTGPVTKPVVTDNIDRVNFVRLVASKMPGYKQSDVKNCVETAGWFTDLKAGSMEAKFACYAAQKGLIASKSKFDSKALVNRVAGLKMIESAFGLDIAGPSKFCGDTTGNEWFTNILEIASSNSFPALYDAAGNCNPDGVLTNADAKAWVNHAKTL
ncbi:MAG: S-layer homology domain-containing protein [Patescibacteria group bacterium]